MKNIMPLFSILMFLFSCHNDKKYELGRNISEIGFIIKYDNEAILGHEICASLYFNGSNYKIQKGYFDCSNYKPELVDENKGVINGCNNKLYMEGDTLKICLVPADTGKYNFHKIKLLFKDKRNNYFVADTTFSFNIKDSIR